MKTITFIIPTYNESARIRQTFDALKRFKMPYGLKLDKVIFVNDGSTDTTEEMIVSAKRSLRKALNAPIEIITYSQNRGKGYAIRTGMKHAHSDYTLFFDADISTPLAELSKFSPYLFSEVDVIIGTRKNGKSTVLVHQPKHREILGKVFTKLTNTILSTNTTDFTCGFKAFSRAAKKSICTKAIVDRWGYDAEFIYLAYREQFSIVEVPVVWSNDARSKVKLYKDAPSSLIELLKIRYYHGMKPALKNALSELNPFAVQPKRA